MGVVHKLKPEIIEFIIQQKKDNPVLSCRGLTDLVAAAFNVNLSKSSINAIIKDNGLSAPIGRRQNRKKSRIEMPALPALENKIVPALEVLPNKQELEAKVQAEAKAEAERLEEERIKAEELKRLEEEKRLAEEEVKKKEEAMLRAAAQAEAEAKRIAEEQEKAKELKRLEEEKLAQEALRKKEEEEAKRLEFERIKASELRRIEDDERKKSEEERASFSIKFDLALDIENSGALLLKAADYLIGASTRIADKIKQELNYNKNILPEIENIIYAPLFNKEPDFSQFQNAKIINLEVLRILTLALREVRCLKVILSDGSSLYLDGKFHSVWSTSYVPYSFAAPFYNIKDYINNYFYEDRPLIIFNAPGYDIPSIEFFNFIFGLEAQSARFTNLVLYGNKFEELEAMTLSSTKKRSFVFGLWPWQFVSYRKVRSLGEFRPYKFSLQSKDFYIADIELELFLANAQKNVILRGAALKASREDKIRQVVLSNIPVELKSAEEIVSLYLSHWPNLEEAFQDYSRKIELFTYTANSQPFFSSEKINLGPEENSDLKNTFNKYLEALDLYVRWHFLPSGYENIDFSRTKENFYNLKANLTKSDGVTKVKFEAPVNYAFSKDLAYLARRINEEEVRLRDSSRLVIL